MTSKENIHPAALVTGASSGIGREYARQLAGMGYNLLLVSNEEKQLYKVSGELASEYGVRVTPLCMDLAQTGAARQLYDYCQKEGFEVEILINNAGIFFFSDIADTSAERLQQITLLHVVTPTLLCRYFGEAMRQRRKGYILNMSSMSAWISSPCIVAYSSTKAYLNTFSRALHIEMKPYNVGVTTITPGAIATGLYRLDEKYMNLGLRLGIITPAPWLVKRALKGMFKHKKTIGFGCMNRVFIALFSLLPDSLLCFIRKKISKYGW